MNPLNFIGSSLDDLRNFPEEARKAAGFELYSVQCGQEPSDWKPMPSIGRGVKEIRIHVLENGVSSTWRSSRMRFMFSIHFKRKAEKTNQHDVEIARKRYKQIGE